MANENKVLSDEDLKNVAGGAPLNSLTCSLYTTEKDCMAHRGCLWVEGACIVGVTTRSL